MNVSGELQSWAAAQYPHLPYVTYGVSGSALLLHALQQADRRTIILPAFICPELPAMAARAGLRVIHVDVDRRTLHMNTDRLDECLKNHISSETALVVDHSFGYPDREIIRCRRSYPDLLIIEDAVRALGGEIDGAPVGAHGDWVLFSMYKTTRGNDDGAMLMMGDQVLTASRNGETALGTSNGGIDGGPAHRARVAQAAASRNGTRGEERGCTALGAGHRRSELVDAPQVRGSTDRAGGRP